MATMAHTELIMRRCVRTGDNAMFRSPPARGKTWKIEAVMDAMLQAGEIDYAAHFDGGTLVPTDTAMSMPDMVERLIRVVRDARLPNFYDKPALRGFIYIGEWMLMDLVTSKGFQKLLNHEELGGFRVPPGVVFVADGNRQQDRSGGQVQSRAIMSRFEVYDLDYDVDYALSVAKTAYHEKIAAFLIRHPDMIDNYTDVFENDKRSANDLTLNEGKNGAWANLRSWAKVSRKLRDEEATNIAVLPDELNACLGSGVAQTFQVFVSMLDQLATMEDIIAAPTKAEVPTRMDARYALSTMLALTVAKDTFKPISIYLNRFPDELQAAFFRLMNDRLARVARTDVNASAIRSSTEYRKWITAPHISAILLGASQA